MNKLEICRLTVITGNKSIYYQHRGETIGGGHILSINETPTNYEIVGVPSKVMNSDEMKIINVDDRKKIMDKERQLLSIVSKEATCVIDYY